MAQKMLSAIDLFAGAGGLTEGFRQAGFRCLAANDFDSAAAKTFKASHPEATFIEGKIEKISNGLLREVAGVAKGDLDVLLGGPPCQAFSVYNHQRGFHDERSGLFREYLRIVDGLMPQFVVMENVTGIKSVGNGRAVTEITESLQKLGYFVEHRILKAEEYGVPQERRRIFFIGSRDSNSIPWPKATHIAGDELPLLVNGNKGLAPFVSVWEAIGDLPELAICEGEDTSQYSESAKCDYQRYMRNGSKALYNHVAPSLQDINLKRLKHIPQGGSWRDIPFALLPPGMKRARRCDHTKRYGRLHPDGLASTILTKCDLHWGAYIHPFQERTLTVREAARFQSFPDRIRFLGSRVEQFKQVGNAVPPLLARAVARPIARVLRKATRSPRKSQLVA